MQFKANATVVSAEGKALGHVRRVVVDPHTDEVRDLVVHSGTLLAEERVMPIGMVKETDGEHVQTQIKTEDFEKLDLFEEAHYVAAAEGDSLAVPVAPVYYWYPPVGGLSPGYAGAVPPEVLGYQLRQERHIPPNTVALKEGAPVKSRDGHEVGKLEQVVTAPGGDHATHVVVAAGLLHKTRRVIPVDWIATIEEAQVTLGVPANVVEKLPAQEH